MLAKAEQAGNDRARSDEVERNYISVWLMPEQAQSGFLREMVDGLADKFDTYPFDPHLTIISSFNAPPDEVGDAIAPLTGKREESFKFEVDDVVIGDVMTKTLYVTFKPVGGFTEYCETFKGSPVTAGAKIPAPHMSLMYKEGGPNGLAEDGRRKLDQLRLEIKDLFQLYLPYITFDRVSLVVSEHTLQHDKDVLAYETKATYRV